MSIKTVSELDAIVLSGDAPKNCYGFPDILSGETTRLVLDNHQVENLGYEYLHLYMPSMNHPGIVVSIPDLLAAILSMCPQGASSIDDNIDVSACGCFICSVDGDDEDEDEELEADPDLENL